MQELAISKIRSTYKRRQKSPSVDLKLHARSRMPISNDIRWPWESSDDSSAPPPQSPTPPNSPGSNGRKRSAGPSAAFVHTEPHTQHYKRSHDPGSDLSQQTHRQNRGLEKPANTSDFALEMLIAHNRYRALHQAPPLRLDANLTSGAQHWAEVIAKQDRLQADMDVKNAHLGENLAMKFSSHRSDFTGSEFTDYWYSGIGDYDFLAHAPKLQRGSGALSFTQLVWKASELVGFGRAVSSRGRVFVVGRYFPGGNAVESFAQNVMPAGTRHDDRPATSEPRHSSKMGEITRSTGSRISETFDPSIGSMMPTDTLVSTTKSTEYLNDRTVQTLEQTFKTKDGATYTRQKKTTYFSGHS